MYMLASCLRMRSRDWFAGMVRTATNSEYIPNFELKVSASAFCCCMINCMLLPTPSTPAYFAMRRIFASYFLSLNYL